MNPPLSPREVPLAQLLRSAAEELALQAPPAELLARIGAAAQAAQAARAQPALPPAPHGRPAFRFAFRPAFRTWARSGAAACACVLVASALLMLRLPPPVPADPGLRAGGFVPLVAPEQWPRDNAPAWLVSTELQGERLAALGLPYDPARAGDSVRAELLLRPSGEVLAVRLVY
jgi:hypothetical protein